MIKTKSMKWFWRFYISLPFNDGYATRAWKGMDWEAMDRLYEKGYISNPKGKAKSVILTEAGKKLSEELFFKNFGARK